MRVATAQGSRAITDHSVGNCGSMSRSYMSQTMPRGRANTSNADGTLKINYAPSDPRAYPISTTTYLLYYKAMADTAKATALKHFAAWVLAEGQKRARDLDYAPMPSTILDKALAVVNG